jgi:hypothetical protein
MTTKYDELFLKAEDIMQEVLRALYNGVKIPAELEQINRKSCPNHDQIQAVNRPFCDLY